MNRLAYLLCAISFVGLSLLNPIALAAQMTFQLTFQLTNDTGRTLNLKFFSRAESRQEWPSKTKAFSVRPESGVQQIKISCEEGEQICWGAWQTVQSVSGEIVGPGGLRATRTSKFSTGVGERGLRTCERCCHICKDGAMTPVKTLHDPKPEAK